MSKIYTLPSGLTIVLANVKSISTIMDQMSIFRGKAQHAYHFYVDDHKLDFETELEANVVREAVINAIEQVEVIDHRKVQT